MKRGSKEFYEVKANFEKALDSGLFGCIPSNFEVDKSHSTVFYANGEVNQAFKIYMAGYAAGMFEYRQ